MDEPNLINNIAKTIVHDPHYWIPALMIFLCVIWMGSRYIILITDNPPVKEEIKIANSISHANNKFPKQYDEKKDSVMDSDKLTNRANFTDKEQSKTTEKKVSKANEGSNKSKEARGKKITVTGGKRTKITIDSIGHEGISSLITRENFEVIQTHISELNLPEETFEIIATQDSNKFVATILIRFIQMPSFTFHIRSVSREYYNSYYIVYSTFPDFKVRYLTSAVNIADIPKYLRAWIQEINRYLNEKNLTQLKVSP